VIIVDGTDMISSPPITVAYFVPPKPVLLHLGNNTDFDFGKHDPASIRFLNRNRAGLDAA
jgi:hypothetical protein